MLVIDRLYGLLICAAGAISSDVGERNSRGW